MKKGFINIIRIGLRLHSVFHFIEFISAIYEDAYITACIALTATLVEIIASFLIPKEHVHIKPFISDVHEDCNKK